MLLGSGAPCQLQTLAGQEHGRTIPLADTLAELPPLKIAHLSVICDVVFYDAVHLTNCRSRVPSKATRIAANPFQNAQLGGIDRPTGSAYLVLCYLSFLEGLTPVNTAIELIHPCDEVSTLGSGMSV